MTNKLITQPPRSKLCGHACVAMAARVSLNEAVSRIGHEKGTKTKELAKALRHYGFRCGQRLTPIRRLGTPARALLKLKYPRPGGNWHWVLLWDNQLYDPAGPDAKYPPGVRFTSYLDLTQHAE